MSTPVVRNLSHKHEWHPVVRMTRTKWQDVCVNCGEHQIVDNAAESPMDPLHDECSGLANVDAWVRAEQLRTDLRALLIGLALLGLSTLIWIIVLL